MRPFVSPASTKANPSAATIGGLCCSRSVRLRLPGKLAVSRQDGPDQAREAFVQFGAARLIAHLHTLALAPDQPGLTQHFEMVGQRRLWNDAVAEIGKRRARPATAGAGKLCINGNALRIGQRIEDRLGLDVLQGWVKERSHEFYIASLDIEINSSEFLNYGTSLPIPAAIQI